MTAEAFDSLDSARDFYMQQLQSPTDRVNSLFQLALIESQSHNYIAAIERLTELLTIDDQHVDALCLLGKTCATVKRYDEAVISYSAALHEDSSRLEIWGDLCDVLLANGNVAAAIEVKDQTLELANFTTAIFCNLGDIFLNRDFSVEAIEIFKQGLERAPNHSSLLLNLGLAYSELNNFSEAAACYLKVIEIAPENPNAYNNYAVLLKQNLQFTTAETVLKKALTINPQHSLLNYHYADILNNLGRYAESVTYYHLVIAANPTFVEAHYGLAYSLLTLGNFKEGWQEYNWRNVDYAIARYKESYNTTRLWQGEHLADQSLVIQADQGFGDTIQFVRYIQYLSRYQPKKIYLAVTEQIRDLLKYVKGIDGIFSDYSDLPVHDCYVPLLSIPGILQTTFEEIPNTVPYLRLDPKLSERWKNKLCSYTDKKVGKKIGLVWQGHNKNLRDTRRSIPFEKLAPLLALSSITFFSLQKDCRVATEYQAHIVDLSEQLTTFSETAAIIQQLDLVITVCTSIAHLAGALGKPVWIMLAHNADWRWFTADRNDSPWYPTATLFRQADFGDWDSVITQIEQAIALL